MPPPANLAALVSASAPRVKPPPSGVDVRQPLTDAELEERRAKQLRAAAALEADHPKTAGGAA